MRAGWRAGGLAGGLAGWLAGWRAGGTSLPSKKFTDRLIWSLRLPVKLEHFDALCSTGHLINDSKGRAGAFDTVLHQRLLLNLENYGIRGNLLSWISYFLTCREMCVVVDGE
ncbi:hypothetical protein DPMN_180289 [Dreissena polymorpha]|uniref:Uncharacterized protein n=1 Tax=Dreissena polymorpha TaxID=45954 RepID=A0A9D4EIW6_DREPO|nr:hypothetical protein DPMN_180289 [Dreissena polymorpha]